jgi:hypothetical protein
LRDSSSRNTAIGVAVAALAIAAMAVDHLMGDDPAVLEDPAAFLMSAGLCIGLAVLVFGWVLPRTRANPDASRRARVAITLAVAAVVGIPLVFWLGLPFVLAGGAVALGLQELRDGRPRLALAAVVLGSLVLVLGTVGYGVQFVDKL